MRIFVLSVVAVWLGMAAPAAAQADAGDDRQLALAERYLEATQGENLRKSIEAYFEDEFSKAEIPAEQRDWLTLNMAIAFDEAMDATFADLTDDVAELYSPAELEDLIAFYDTPLGRSITEKSFDFGIRLEAAMTPHLTAVLGRLGEKFCARFDCGSAEDTVSKSPAPT